MSGIKLANVPNPDQLEIVPRAWAEPVGGARPEPEEMPAARVIKAEQPLLGNLEPGTALGGISTTIRLEDTVETFAQGSRSMCADCVHFDRAAWHDLKRRWDVSSDPEKRRLLNNMRLNLSDHASAEFRDRFENPLDGDFDIDAALMSFGVCRPFTEIFRDAIIVAPIATCPDRGPDGGPAPYLFQPRDAPTDQRINESYDAIMRLAAGE